MLKKVNFCIKMELKREMACVIIRTEIIGKLIRDIGKKFNVVYLFISKNISKIQRKCGHVGLEKSQCVYALFRRVR